MNTRTGAEEPARTDATGVVAPPEEVEETSKQRVDLPLSPLDPATDNATLTIIHRSAQLHSDPIHSVPPNIHSSTIHPEAATSNEAVENTDRLPSILPLSLPPPLPALAARNSTQLLLNRSLSKSNHLASVINQDPAARQNAGVGLESGSSASGVVIGRDRPKEVIRIERDWAQGEDIVQFWSGWVWELEGRMSPKLFQDTMESLNAILASAHDPYKHIVYTIMSILTLYASTLFLKSHYYKMTKFNEALERANREIFNPVGLNILDPARSAYLFLELECY